MASKPAFERTWYHGSASLFSEFGEPGIGRSKDWGTRLGPHFSSQEATACRFATYIAQPADKKRGTNDRVGYVYACKLNIRKAYNVPKEKDLAWSLLAVAAKAGLVPEDFMAPAISTDAKTQDPYQTLLRYHYGSDAWPTLSDRLEAAGLGEQVADYFREYLEGLGYDGVIYGNTNEKEATRYGERTAVPLDRGQIQVLEVARVVNYESPVWSWSEPKGREL